jgi:hypothetical protein
MNHTPFHNFYLSEHGTHISISTAVAMGLIAPSLESGMLIVKGKKMSAAAAIEAGIIDDMAADYLASLPLEPEGMPSFEMQPLVNNRELPMRNTAA